MFLSTQSSSLNANSLIEVVVKVYVTVFCRASVHDDDDPVFNTLFKIWPLRLKSSLTVVDVCVCVY